MDRQKENDKMREEKNITQKKAAQQVRVWKWKMCLYKTTS